MPSSRNTDRHHDDATVAGLADLSDALRIMPRWAVRFPVHMHVTARERARALRESRWSRWLVVALLAITFALTIGLWWQALGHGAASPVDPKIELPVAGAPAAILSYSGLIVTASESGAVSAIDPVSNEPGPKRQLGHPVTALAARGGWLFALGGGRVTRLGPDLTVAKRATVRTAQLMLAAGPAGLWTAGGKTIERVDPHTLRPTARVATAARIAGIAVSERTVWATAPAAQQLLAIVRGSGPGFGVRRVNVGCAAGPVTVAAGWVWTLCSRARRIVGFALDDVRRKAEIPVGAGSTLLASGNHSLYLSSPTSQTVSQYGLSSRRRVGRAIPVGTLASAMTIDLHAVWLASNYDHTLRRLDLAGLKLQRNEVTRWNTIGGWAPDLYLVFAIILTMALIQAYGLWRASDPDAGLPRHHFRDITVLACNILYYQPFSPGTPIERTITSGRALGLHLGSAVSVGTEAGRSETFGTLPDRSVKLGIEEAKRAGRVKQFMNCAPAAGVPGLLRKPRRRRLRHERLRQRYLGLEPFTLCRLSGTWSVSRRPDGEISMELSELLDRDWGRWQPVPVPTGGHLTVTCPRDALNELGMAEIGAEDATSIKMTVLAVPDHRAAADGLHMRLVVAYY